MLDAFLDREGFGGTATQRKPLIERPSVGALSRSAGVFRHWNCYGKRH
ncbi:hypothetical protein RISK_004017 [Rhodopirellula islandica]|uniref:Uncharacterized protein n=1 Tax=Rhodopirellula islandica TaxID=595434 RepID=A0A0J1BBX7_RHOIS|nr:hypothetical protein RISK_004017 [Rhodopirellula islandica]